MSGSEVPAVVAFLTARYDEIEATAKAAHQPNWPWYVEDKGVVTSVDSDGDWDRYVPTSTRSDADHIALNDPAYVLADIEAKRKILKAYETAADALEVARGTVLEGAARLRLATWEAALRLLAAPFRAHPDFDPAWAVQ